MGRERKFSIDPVHTRYIVCTGSIENFLADMSATGIIHF